MSENREINLIELLIIIWRKIKRGIANIFHLVVASLRISIKYFWVVLPIVIIFLIGGYFFSSKHRTKYNADGIITFFTENRLSVDNEIKTLNSLKSNNRARFNELFGITDEQNSRLIEIRALPIIDYLNDFVPDVILPQMSNSIFKDSTSTVVTHMMGIRFILRGTTDYKPYMDGLVAYFDNLPQLLSIDSVAKEMANNRIRFCQQEMERLERLSEYEYFGGGNRFSLNTGSKKDGGGIIIEPSRKKLYYENIQELIEEQDALLSYVTGKEHVINFVSPYMNVFCIPRYIIMALFMIIGFVVGATTAYFIDKQIAERRGKKSLSQSSVTQ